MSHRFILLLIAYVTIIQSGLGSWTYTSGNADTTPSGFTYQATVTETSANTFTGTATLTAFSGSSASIPSTVPIRITVNTTNNQGQPIQYNETVNCAVQGFSEFILNSDDVSFLGTVNITGNFNLNGNDLTVSGSVIHQGGVLNIGGGRLEIGGDYIQGRDLDNNGSYETYCYGYLTMNDPADYMFVGGDAQFWTYGYGAGISSLGAGTIEVKGDFLAKQDGSNYFWWYARSFPAAGTRVLLSGAGAQNVAFENPGAGQFGALEISNTNPAGVTFATDIVCSSLAAPGATLRVGPAGGIQGAIASDVTFAGDTKINGGMSLQGHTVTVSGNLIHQSGALQIGGGRLEIGGDYLQQLDTNGDGTYESACSGYLSMGDSAGYMLVAGSARFRSASGSLNAGTLEVRGDFTQKTNPGSNAACAAAGTHRTLLSGSDIQTVSFDTPTNSFFNILEVTNATPLVFESVVKASQVRSPARLVIQSPTDSGICGTLECDISFTGTSFAMLSPMDLAGHAVAVNCSVKQHNLNINGGEFSVTGTGEWHMFGSLSIGPNGRIAVPGNFIHENGEVYVGGGRLEIGGDYIQGRDLDNNGSYETYCYGYLTMNDPADYMFVGGDAQFWTYGYGAGISSLGAGTIEVKGDFLAKQDGSNYFWWYARSFPAAGTRVLLSGAGAQNVAFENPGAGQFGALEISNTSSITLTTSVQLSKLISAFATIHASLPTNMLVLSGSPTEFAISGNTMLSCGVTGSYGLTKTGTGSLVLNAANTFTGATTVSAGTLVLKSPGSADAGAVAVSGGTLNLDFAGADIVSSLTLNGTAQPNGLYDSTNTNGLITGTGKIQVGPFANFSAWAAANTPGQTAAQDYDHDGVPNGVEYFIGANGSGFTPNPALINGTVTWHKSVAFAGTYQVQTSPDLGNWTDVTSDPAQVTISPLSVIWTRPAVPGNRFVRLLVMPN